jgi:HSP20 family protein
MTMAQNPLAPWRRGAMAPFGGFPFGGLQEQMNRLFDDFWRDFGGGETPTAGVATLQPQIDVSEDEEAWRISAEMPSVEEKDVELAVAEGVLTLAGEKKLESERKERNWHVSERSFGSFRRSFRLPPGADTEKIAAKFDKGVLEVTIPKLPEARQTSRRIEIGKG